MTHGAPHRYLDARVDGFSRGGKTAFCTHKDKRIEVPLDAVLGVLVIGQTSFFVSESWLKQARLVKGNR